jgi:hypothetical protein
MLVSTSVYLSIAGRLELVNAVFTALPTFAMSSFLLLLKIVVKQIDKFRKHCLWRGPDLQSKKPNKATWQMVNVPKEKGGLGVLNLQTQNQSLLLKNPHKFFNKVDTPWVHLIWNCYYSMVNCLWWKTEKDHSGGVTLLSSLIFQRSSCSFGPQWCFLFLLAGCLEQSTSITTFPTAFFLR